MQNPRDPGAGIAGAPCLVGSDDTAFCGGPVSENQDTRLRPNQAAVVARYRTTVTAAYRRAARKRTSKPGWVAMTCKEQSRAWPSVKQWALPKPERLEAATRSWVRSRQIAYTTAAQRRGGAA